MLQGTVIFKLANRKSKSEAVLPYLLLENGDYVKIFALDDNPFENNILREYEGKSVRVEGEYNDTNMFIITEIHEDLAEEEHSGEAEEAAEKITAEEAEAPEAACEDEVPCDKCAEGAVETAEIEASEEAAAEVEETAEAAEEVTSDEADKPSAIADGEAASDEVEEISAPEDNLAECLDEDAEKENGEQA